jgi:hypothetical protein
MSSQIIETQTPTPELKTRPTRIFLEVVHRADQPTHGWAFLENSDIIVALNAEHRLVRYALGHRLEGVLAGVGAGNYHTYQLAWLISLLLTQVLSLCRNEPFVDAAFRRIRDKFLPEQPRASKEMLTLSEALAVSDPIQSAVKEIFIHSAMMPRLLMMSVQTGNEG